MKSQVGVRRGQPPHRFILTPVSSAPVTVSSDTNQPLSPQRPSSTASSPNNYPTPPPSNLVDDFQGFQGFDDPAFNTFLQQSPMLLNSPIYSQMAADFQPTFPFDLQQTPFDDVCHDDQEFNRLLVRDCMWSPDHSNSVSPVHFDMNISNNDALLFNTKEQANYLEENFVDPSSILPRMCSCSTQQNDSQHHNCPHSLTTARSATTLDDAVATFFANDECCDQCDSDCLQIFHQHNGGNSSENALEPSIDSSTPVKSSLNGSYSDSDFDSGIDTSSNGRPNHLRACVTGRRTLASVLKRNIDLFDDYGNGNNSNTCNSDMSGGSMVDQSSIASPPVKRSRQPTVITLKTEEEPSTFDVASYHSYTKTAPSAVRIVNSNQHDQSQANNDVCPPFFQPYHEDSSSNHHSNDYTTTNTWSTCSSRASTPALAHTIYVQQSNGSTYHHQPGRLYHQQIQHHHHQSLLHHHNQNGIKRTVGSTRHSSVHGRSVKRKNPNDHIKMERERRNDLKATFHHVREEIPELSHVPKPSKLAILDKAREYIESMKTSLEDLSAEKARLMRANEQMMARLDALQRAQKGQSSSHGCVTTSSNGSNNNGSSYVIVSATPMSN